MMAISGRAFIVGNTQTESPARFPAVARARSVCLLRKARFPISRALPNRPDRAHTFEGRTAALVSCPAPQARFYET
jgi:hypothetical protein